MEEGTYAYAVSMPEQTIPSPSVITSESVTVINDQSYIQSLLDTIASQRLEIETQKQILEFLVHTLTYKQRESLKYLASLLTEEKK